MLAVAATALFVRLELDPQAAHLITSYPAIMGSAWFGGLGLGIAATLLSMLSADHWLIEPRYTHLRLAKPADIVELATFARVGMFMNVLTEAGSPLPAREREGRRMPEGTAAASAAGKRRRSVTLARIGDAIIATYDQASVTL